MTRPLKPGPKPIAKSTGKVDKRRRDNKKTPKNNDDLKPSKSSEKQPEADVKIMLSIIQQTHDNPDH